MLKCLKSGFANTFMSDDTTNAAKATADRYASRPDAAVVAAQTMKATMAARGFVCPNCHCCDTRILRTTPGDNEKTRRRVCRNCGKRITTMEVPVS